MFTFDFFDSLYPGEGRSFDVVSDTDVSSYNVTASIYKQLTNALIASCQVTGPIDPYTWRVHVTDNMTRNAAGTRLLLRVTVQDPANQSEPEIVEALITVAPQ